MDDLAQARERMVVEQLERRGIRDSRVLAAMRMVERDRFIPAEYAEHAYDDEPLPIGAEQTISQPYMVALMCEVARLTGVERVLEVGTGSGYEQAPFDVIVVTAAMPGIARPLLEQLKPDGRLVAPIGEDDLQTLVRISRRDDAWSEEYFGECRFVKMTGRYGFKTQ